MKKLVALTLLLPGLTACIALITPSVEQDIKRLKPGSYSLDKSHAALLFKVQHLGLSSYVGRFNSLDAALEFDPADPASAKLTALIEMGSIEINDESLASTIKGRSWFNVEQYPQAEFTTLSVKATGENTFAFKGQLTWRGVSKPLTLSATFHGGANNILTGKYTLGFSASGQFLRSDYGLDAFIPLVGDEINLEGYAEFLRN